MWAGTATGQCAPRRVTRALPCSPGVTQPAGRAAVTPCPRGHTAEGQWGQPVCCATVTPVPVGTLWRDSGRPRAWREGLGRPHGSSTSRKGCVSSQKKGCPQPAVGTSGLLRVTSSPSSEQGQEQETSASSFQTPANTPPAQDDWKQI